MGRKTNRLYLYVAFCSAVGVVLGGTASRAEINQCLVADTPADHCLSQNRVTKIVEGMGVGLVAGAGAAVGATWQIWRGDSE